MNIQNLNINYIVNYLAIRNFNLIYENDEKKFSVFYSDYYKAFILARKEDGMFLFIGYQQSETGNGKYFCHRLSSMFENYLECNSKKVIGKFSFSKLPFYTFEEQYLYDTTDISIPDFYEFDSEQRRKYEKMHVDVLSRNLFEKYKDDIKLEEFLYKLKDYIGKEYNAKIFGEIVLSRLEDVDGIIKEIIIEQLLDEYEKYKDEQNDLNSIYKKYVKLKFNKKEFALKVKSLWGGNEI